MHAAHERYVSLATFRRNGREVRTPVWIAADGECLYVYTNRTSGKAKRIRANGRVRLAPCDVRGKLRGDWVDGSARMLSDGAEVERGFAAVMGKYGWQLRLALFTSRLSGRYKDRAIIEIQLGCRLDGNVQPRSSGGVQPVSPSTQGFTSPTTNAAPSRARTPSASE